jgi:hypothetical protein
MRFIRLTSNHCLFGGVVLSLLLHGTGMFLINVRFLSRPEPLLPEMHFWGSIIDSFENKSGVDIGFSPEMRRLLFVRDPRLYLRGILPQKPGRYFPVAENKRYHRDNFLDEETMLRLERPLPDELERDAVVTPLESFQRLRLP